MIACRRPLSVALFLLALLALSSLTRDGWSQKAPPPNQPNPQAPTIAMPAPLGAQRGTSLELTLTGTNLAGPTGLLTTFPAQVTFPTGNNNGKDETKLRVRLDVPKDAPLGFHTLRLATTRGVSNLRMFCVDELPQVVEVDTNRNKATPQAVAVPCVVVGRADTEANDYFKITTTAGQRLSFEILGRRLGSALDPQISLYDAKTGRELPAGHSNDAPGLQTDARMTYTFKEAGDYLVEVRDVMYRGGADNWYRLRIGDFPCATTALPMAVRRGNQASITFAGPAVEGVAPVEVLVPGEVGVDAVAVAPKGASGLYGWPVSLAVSDVDEVVEQEPNQEPAKATRIPVPGGVTGRFHESGDLDHYVFAAQKGQRYILDVQTHAWQSPTEVYLIVKDAKGAQLAVSNPMTTPRLDLTAATDGDLTLSVEHLLYWGGPSETYHLSVRPYEPGFDLSLALDRYDVPQGAVAAIPLQLNRQGYTGPIEVSVIGPPGISGQLTIPAGTGAPPAAKGKAAAKTPAPPPITLFLVASPEAPLGPCFVAIQGKAVINGKTVVVDASVQASISQSLATLPYPPRQFFRQVALTVTPKPPFTLTARLDQPEAIRGVAAPVTITVARSPGFAEEIALAPLGLPANVKPALKNIAKDQTESKGQLTAAAAAVLGQYPISFTGKAKVQNKEISVTAPPVTLVLTTAFNLKTEPSVLTLMAGGKAKLKVTATRRGGHQAPIKLQLRNLPANVTAPETTLAMGQNSVEIELTAAANAAAGDQGDVSVLGSADAPTKEQDASPNFTVRVQTIPFELKAEPTPLKLKPGGKAKVKVTATRKTYQGPITVELRNLPANVTAPKATIAQGQNVVEIELTADAKTALGDKADVQAVGITEGANPQSASAPLTVSVQKE